MKPKYEIFAEGDENTKTYKIIKAWGDGDITVYRTGELTEQEFEEMEYNTPRDWQNYLNTSSDYYALK